MDFYERLTVSKKQYKLNNNVLSKIIGLNSGDAFRMAVGRKSLSSLEIKELEQYFKELGSLDF